MSTSTTPDGISLLEHLDLSQVTCLNEASGHEIKEILQSKKQNTGTNYLLSDADEQLLINIMFNQKVRIKSLLITSKEASQAPKKIKLFINRSAIGFEDVEDAEEPDAAQVLDLSEEDVKEGAAPIKLRFVRFQSVNSLHIFVASNQGDESESRVDVIDVFGDVLESTKDLSGLRKQEE